MKGSHTSLSIKPRSRLLVLGCMWMCTASSAFLFHSCCSTSLMFAPSQSILWSSSHACMAILLFLSPLLTAALCSVILFWRLLPVSPIYTSHSPGMVSRKPLLSKSTVNERLDTAVRRICYDFFVKIVDHVWYPWCRRWSLVHCGEQERCFRRHAKKATEAIQSWSYPSRGPCFTQNKLHDTVYVVEGLWSKAPITRILAASCVKVSMAHVHVHVYLVHSKRICSSLSVMIVALLLYS